MPHPLKFPSFVIFWYLAAPCDKVIKLSFDLMLPGAKIVNWSLDSEVGEDS